MEDNNIDNNKPDNTEEVWKPIKDDDNTFTFREAVYVVLVIFAFVAGILLLVNGITDNVSDPTEGMNETNPTELVLTDKEQRYSDQYDYMKEFTFTYTTGDEYAELYEVAASYAGDADFFVMMNGEGYEGYSQLLNKNTTYEFRIVFFGMDLLESKMFKLYQVRLEINDDFHYTPIYYSGE